MSEFPLPLATAVSTGVRPIGHGDKFLAPIQIFGATGTVDVFFWGGGPEPEEQGAYTTNDQSIWVDYLSTEAGTLTITAPAGCHVEIGTGDDVTSFTVLATGDPSSGSGVAANIGANTPAKIRVRPTVPEIYSIELTYAFVNLVPDLVLNVLSHLRQAPGTFRVTVTNGVPGEAVTFVSSPATIPGGVLDEAGALISFAIFIDDARAAGDYTLTASSTDRDDATATFTVDLEPLSDPLGQPTDADPTAVAPVDGVRKWVLQDPAPSGIEYVFEINPDSATSPWPSNVFTTDETVAPDGQHLTWEGARRPVDWSFKGTLLTQDQYEAFEHFLALNRRVYLIDNRNRAWVVSVESFDPEPKRVVDNPWAHTYTVRTIIYKGAGDSGMTVRWTFTDMATSETITLPWNPNKMTSPFLDNLTEKAPLSPIDGESRGKRKKSPPKDWSFRGFIRTEAQHTLMLDWGLRSSLMHVTDHFGRTIACRFQTIVMDERKPTALKPWKFEYTILALSYGKV